MSVPQVLDQVELYLGGAGERSGRAPRLLARIGSPLPHPLAEVVHEFLERRPLRQRLALPLPTEHRCEFPELGLQSTKTPLLVFDTLAELGFQRLACYVARETTARPL